MNYILKKLYRKKSILLQNKYNNIKNNKVQNEDIIYLMQNSVDNLKLINLIYTRADIELLKYDNTNYPETLLKSEMINRFGFFALILGYIDAYIDYLNSNNNNYYANEILDLRKNIINDYINSTKLSEPKIVLNTILSFPCYNNFNNCFIDLINYKYNLRLQLDFINYYILGYKNLYSHSLDEVYNKYITLKKELEVYINKNFNKTDRVRKLTKKY